MTSMPCCFPAEELRTCGRDADYFYAQLTRNSHTDADGPEFWISPPQYDAPYRSARELGQGISRVTA